MYVLSIEVCVINLYIAAAKFLKLIRLSIHTYRLSLHAKNLTTLMAGEYAVPCETLEPTCTHVWSAVIQVLHMYVCTTRLNGELTDYINCLPKQSNFHFQC